MAATLAAARGAFPGRRLVLAFQPHRFTRTRDLFEDFVRVLSTTDELVLADVYPAGEAPIVAADGRALARAVRVAGKTSPLFVEKTSEMRDAGCSRAFAMATWCSRWARVPAAKPEEASRSALKQLVRTFFNNSTGSAIAALLDIRSTQLTAAEYRQLSALLRRAREQGDER